MFLYLNPVSDTKYRWELLDDQRRKIAWSYFATSKEQAKKEGLSYAKRIPQDVVYVGS